MVLSLQCDAKLTGLGVDLEDAPHLVGWRGMGWLSLPKRAKIDKDVDPVLGAFSPTGIGFAMSTAAEVDGITRALEQITRDEALVSR